MTHNRGRRRVREVRMLAILGWAIAEKGITVRAALSAPSQIQRSSEEREAYGLTARHYNAYRVRRSRAD